MAKYRKKPVVIEAWRLTHESRWDNSDWPRWMYEAWQGPDNETGTVTAIPDSDDLIVGTLEGTMRATVGDFIIQGVTGELYPCKPDIFEATYEPA